MSTHFLPSDLNLDPLAVRAMKRPVPVSITFAMEPGLLQTLEGLVHYSAGDALMLGLRGEQWPVHRAHFDATYQACTGTVAGQDGLYTKRPLVVRARQIPQTFTAKAGHAKDPLQGRVGDWLLQYAPGEYGIVAADIFALTYEVLDT